jgi:DNA-binding CsgD family transcriptional regulator/predicted negative regulator of RcsB-dependent stress response
LGDRDAAGRGVATACVGVGLGLGDTVGTAGLAEGMLPFVLHATMPTVRQRAKNSERKAIMANMGYTVPMRALPRGARLASARAHFAQAEFDLARRDLQSLLERSGHAADAAPLLARVELRTENPQDALAVLARYASSAATNAQKAEVAMLKGAAFARSGDPASAMQHFKTAEKLDSSDALRSELLCHIAAAHWMERDTSKALAALDALPPNPNLDVRLHAGILRGAIASAQGLLAQQGAVLLGALSEIRDEEPDVYLYAVLTTNIAALAVELASTELRDAALHHVDRIAWTVDLADRHFHALRALAWRSALEGDGFNAFRRLKQALSVTLSPAWRVAALADRAYLADALGERHWAAQELRDARDLAATIDWNAVAGEEKLALPVLAELFAPRDPSVAIAYIAMFQRVGHNYPRVLSSSHDVRVEALEKYALGKVQLELGERDEAARLLTAAWEIYERLGIRWRAGRAALALAEISDPATWRSRAEEALAAYPQSWLTRGNLPTRMAIAPSSMLERLTPAQRLVLELLVDGRSTEEITGKLGRSEFTVRNHIKALFKAYGVNSRAALIVKATQRQDF